MDTLSDALLIAVAIGVAGFLFAFGFQKGLENKDRDWIDYTVSEGYAEFFLDANNQRAWRWREAQ